MLAVLFGVIARKRWCVALAAALVIALASSVAFRALGLAGSAEKALGQKIVVVNKPGASGTVATTELTRAKPDGYTLVSNTDTPIMRSSSRKPAPTSLD